MLEFLGDEPKVTKCKPEPERSAPITAEVEKPYFTLVWVRQNEPNAALPLHINGDSQLVIEWHNAKAQNKLND